MLIYMETEQRSNAPNIADLNRHTTRPDHLTATLLAETRRHPSIAKMQLKEDGRLAPAKRKQSEASTRGRGCPYCTSWRRRTRRLSRRRRRRRRRVARRRRRVLSLWRCNSLASLWQRVDSGCSVEDNLDAPLTGCLASGATLRSPVLHTGLATRARGATLLIGRRVMSLH